MHKIPEFLIKPGISFSEEDVQAAMQWYKYTTSNGMISYSIYNVFDDGPYSIFCTEENNIKKFRFLWDPDHFYDEKIFLKIGKNPNLLVLK